jgi:hypothetical protein
MDEGELVGRERVKEPVPVLSRDGVMEEELGPYGLRNMRYEFPIVRSV